MKGVDSARCVILLCVITYCTGVRLAPCQSGVVEMLRNADNLSFTCDQYSGTVTWYFARHNTPNMLESIGTCNTRRCQVNKRWVQGGGFSLKFLTATSSRLMLSKPVTERHYRWTYGCDDSQGIDKCQVDIVSHAVIPPSSLTFTSTHWNVQGSSDVISVYSSLGRYSCELRERRETGHVTVLSNATLTLTPDPSDVRNTQDRRGTCSFSKRLPTDDGNYTYTVVVSPGNTERTVGSVEIVRPVMPRVSCCTSPYVPGQNTSVVCTCNTHSVGRPEGRLRWFRGSGNYIPIDSGNYGDTSLIMTPQTLTQADYDVTIFRCDVDWVETVSGETYTSRLRYQASGLTVVLGVTAALLLLLLVTIIVFCCWLWRRGWVMPCAVTARQSTPPQALLATDADGYLIPAGMMGEPNTGPSGPYDALRLDGLGRESPYAEISCRGNH